MGTKHLSRELEQLDAVDLSSVDWAAVDAQLEKDLAALAAVDLSAELSALDGAGAQLEKDLAALALLEPPG